MMSRIDGHATQGEQVSLPVCYQLISAGSRDQLHKARVFRLFVFVHPSENNNNNNNNNGSCDEKKSFDVSLFGRRRSRKVILYINRYLCGITDRWDRESKKS